MRPEELKNLVEEINLKTRELEQICCNLRRLDPNQNLYKPLKVRLIQVDLEDYPENLRAYIKGEAQDIERFYFQYIEDQKEEYLSVIEAKKDSLTNLFRCLGKQKFTEREVTFYTLKHGKDSLKENHEIEEDEELDHIEGEVTNDL